MKKIIYSLVIMIAAGSLFTSCVNYDEPVGVQGLREAKAAYLDALSGLRAADAAVQNAVAEVEKAKAAHEQAFAEYQRLLNEAQAIDNDEERAKADLAIQKAQQDMETSALAHQQAMAKAQQEFDKLQKAIAAEALTLTTAERTAIKNATDNYNTAVANFNTAVKDVEDAQVALYNAEVYGFNGMSKEEFIESENATKAFNNYVISLYGAEIERIESNEDLNDWLDYLDELETEYYEDTYEYANLLAARDVIAATDSTDAAMVALDAVKTWVKANPTPNASLKAAVNFNKKDAYGVTEEVQGATDYSLGSTWFKNLMTNYVANIVVKAPVGPDGKEGKIGPKELEEFNWAILDTPAETATTYLVGDGGKALAALNAEPEGPGAGLKPVPPVPGPKEEEAFRAELKALGINGVIKTIEDSKVLEADTATVKYLKEEYEEAKEYFDCALDVLKAGIRDFIANDDSVKVKEADTLATYELLVAAAEAYEAAEATREEVFTKDSLAAAEFVDAMASLINQVVKFRSYEVIDYNFNNFFKGYGAPAEGSATDFESAITSQRGSFYAESSLSNLLDSVKAVVAARQELLGEQSSDFVKYLVADNNGVHQDSVAILDLKVEDLKQTPAAFYVTEGPVVDTVHFLMQNKFTQVQKNTFQYGNGYNYNYNFNPYTIYGLSFAPYFYESQYVKVISSSNPYSDGKIHPIYNAEGNYYLNNSIVTPLDYYLLAYSVPVLGSGNLFSTSGLFKGDNAPSEYPTIEKYKVEVDASVEFAPDPVSVLFKNFGLYSGDNWTIKGGKGKEIVSDFEAWEINYGNGFWESDNKIYNRWPSFVEVKNYAGKYPTIDYTKTFLKFAFSYDDDVLFPLYTEGTQYAGLDNFGFGTYDLVKAFMNKALDMDIDYNHYKDYKAPSEWLSEYKANSNMGFTPADYVDAFWKAVKTYWAFNNAKDNHESAQYAFVYSIENAIDNYNDIIDQTFGPLGKGPKGMTVAEWFEFEDSDRFSGIHHYNYFDPEDTDIDESQEYLAAFIAAYEEAIAKLDPYIEYSVDGNLVSNTKNAASLQILEDIISVYFNNFTWGWDVLKAEDFANIIFGDKDNPTLFTYLKQAEFAYNITANRKETVAYFEAVKAWAAGLQAAIDETNEANKEYYNAWNTWFGSFSGETIFDAKNQPTKLSSLQTKYGYVAATTTTPKVEPSATIAQIKAAKGGQLKTIYTENLKAVFDQLAEIDKQIKYDFARTDALADLIKTINNDLVPYFALMENPTLYYEAETLAGLVDEIIEKYENTIKSYKSKNKIIDQTLAELAAGVDEDTIAVNVAKRALEAAQIKLAQAEEALKLAKAEYEAVIAKYVEK